MGRLVILGAGIAGHTAALHASRKLKGSHELIVISPNSNWNWIPSNIWVGVGFMKSKQVIFPLKPVYKKMGATYIQAKAISIHPEGDKETDSPYVMIEYTEDGKIGKTEKVKYDYLMNATGPKLKFEATEGLGPGKNSVSVCTPSHATEASRQLHESIERMKHGEKQTFVIGTGHGMCTCQGAAFEYLFNVEYLLRKKGVRDKAKIINLTNEYEIGDFGIGGSHIKKGGFITHSRIFTESLFTERGIEWRTGTHVRNVGQNEVFYENLKGQEKTVKKDFAMLLPPFSGVGISSYNKIGEDITSTLFAPNGFMKVDADYTKKPYEEWKASDWPSTYQNPTYKNIFAVGIAFAPPHAISKPQVNPNGTPISPTPPRTGMPSGVIGREVVYSIIDMMNGVSDKPTRTASMAKMGASCIASAGFNKFNGTAVSMSMFPIVPDFEKYPETGRDINYTTGEIGLAGHWIKHLLHFAFLYKGKANPFWQIIPE